MFCELYNIFYKKGKIILNSFPREFAKLMKSHPSLISCSNFEKFLDFISLLKGAKEYANKENIPLCWYLTADLIQKNVNFCGVIH
jgi:hypothetical protein